MKRIVKKFVQSGLVLMVLFMALSFVPNAAYAEDDDDEISYPVTLADYTDPEKYANGKAVGNLVFFGFAKEKLSTLLPAADSHHQPADENTQESYEAVYPDSLSFFGQPVTVKLDITFLGGNSFGYNSTGDNTEIWHTENEPTNNRQKYSVWIKAFGADFKVKVSFFEDAQCTKPYAFTGALSFIDPDQANYEFPVYDSDASNHQYREFYYTNKDSLNQKYNVVANGLDRISWGNIADAELGVALYNESSFEFTIHGYGDWIFLPDFIVVDAPYKIEYYYQKNGVYDENNPDDNDTRTTNIYYNPTVTVTKSDKDPDPTICAQLQGNYVLDESTERKAAWELPWQFTTDTDGQTVLSGTPVLKVYFKEQFRVTYHDDLNQTVFNDTGRSNYEYGEITDKYTPTAAPKGYEFVGWSEEKNTDPDATDKILSPEDVAKRTVTEDKDYYAVWRPLDYVIKYRPNYDGFTGEFMEDDTYYITSPSMNSKDEWTYTRDGYKFIGYSVEDPSGTLVPVESDDFVHDFIDTLPDETDRTIILYAQWTPVYTIQYRPNYDDFTGEYMPDDTYYGTSPSMNSKDEWTYTRKGYKFIGYSVEDENGNLVPVNSDDFAHDFIDMLPYEDDRLVILYAQWEKLPVVPYALPVTGVDR